MQRRFQEDNLHDAGFMVAPTSSIYPGLGITHDMTRTRAWSTRPSISFSGDSLFA